MAVGSLQEAGVSVTGQLCHRLLVYAVVKHSGHKIVTEGVQMELSRKSVLIIETAEMPRERIRVHQLPSLICEHIIAHLKAANLCLAHFLVAVAAEDTGHVFAEIDYSGLPIFRSSLDHTLTWNRAAGAADGQDALVAIHNDVLPFEGTQLSPAAAGIDCQGVKGLVGIIFVGENVQKSMASSSVGISCVLDVVSGRSIIRAGFFSMISFRFASLSTAEATVKYFWTVAS